MSDKHRVAEISEILSKGFLRLVKSGSYLSNPLDNPSQTSDVSNPWVYSPSPLTERGSDV